MTGTPCLWWLQVVVKPVASPIQAMLSGPSGDVRADQTIKLNAVASVDPDDPQGNKPMTFTWECQSTLWPRPCIEGANQGTISGGTWELPASLLAEDTVHTFTVTVSKGVRTSKASLQVRPRPTFVPSGTLQRVCQPCPAEHNTDLPLRVSLRLDAGVAASGLSIKWSVDQGALPANTENRTSIDIPVSMLPGSGALTVRALLSFGQGRSSETSLVVPLNQLPVVIGKLTVETETDVFPDATFKVRTSSRVT